MNGAGPQTLIGSYQLLDFGRGRKLEQFGPMRIDRPAPAAAPALPTRPELWPSAQARFDRRDAQQGDWSTQGELSTTWTWPHPPLTLELRLAPSGQVGLFPEHLLHAPWLAERPGGDRQEDTVLNLFAYTGAATLLLAAAGWRVVHLDAARPAVQWARRNAELSWLADRPIRWIVDDATAFVERQVRRGSRFRGIVLDPPSYGRAARGRDWSLARDLPGLLANCQKLLSGGGPRFLLLSCHTEGLTVEQLSNGVRQGLGPGWKLEPLALELATADGRRLPSGIAVRATAG